MRDVKAVGDGRLDTWEAVRMNERSYWDQFLKTGRVEDYLQYRNQIQARNALRNRAKSHESSSFTSSFRRKGAGTGWGTTCRIGSKCSGIVLKAEPIGEYDRRVVILTREKGKISAFARGARKPTSAFLAPTSPFTFGTFELYAGRNSYSVCDISANCYFEELRQDFEGAYYGMYFLELADYCTRENNDEREV